MVIKIKLRVSGIVNDSIVDGPGLRLAIFTQGCIHKCKGCHNPSTHDINGGYDMDIDEVLDIINKNPLLNGVTFSGGEPFLQSIELTELAKKIKKLNLNIIAYSGYVFEEILQNNNMLELAENIDLIIDGKFIEEEKTLSLRFRGSKNQRIIDTKQSIELGETIEVEI